MSVSAGLVISGRCCQKIALRRLSIHTMPAVLGCVATLHQSLGANPEDFFQAPSYEDRDDRDHRDNSCSSAPRASENAYLAVSVVRGREKYERMLKSNSADVAWRVALKTDRRARTLYGDQLPNGFPHLHEFFTSCKSLRVFKIGFSVYRTLYDKVSYWHDWHTDVDNVAEWQVQALRSEIIAKFTPSLNGGGKPTRLQLSILRFTVEESLWPTVLAPSLPKRLRLEIRWGLARWSLRVRRYARVWLENHVDLQAAKPGQCLNNNKDHTVHTLVERAPGSPSLKRRRID